MPESLPIYEIIPEIQSKLMTHDRLVIHAPPGAGKTTVVPLELMNQAWLDGKKIVMLEPRRLAAVASARRMAQMLGEQVGETVGYRVRLDSKVSSKTRIEVVTEGILTRQIQSDPELDGVGALIFDEFHERSLNADLGLALSCDVQEGLRDDLKIIVMSATLDSEAVAGKLNAPVAACEGRCYPVETIHAPSVVGRFDLVSEIVRTVHRAVNEQPDSSILVFLPGVGEIRRVETELGASLDDGQVTIAPLYGNLTREQQDRAIQPCPHGRRKVVLATSIAETSLTINGINVVIDAGLMRVPSFDPNSGMTRLETLRVSRASADQRRGRAGRLAPGVCYRLWTQGEDQRLEASTTAEVLNADLAGLTLELAQWGVDDPGQMIWMDVLPVAAFQEGRSLLHRLHALDERGRITDHGREMLRLGAHPRLAHMLIKGKEIANDMTGPILAAILSERDPLKPDREHTDSDIATRVEAVQAIRQKRNYRVPGYRLDQGACRTISDLAKQWSSRLGIRKDGVSADMVGRLVALAYPDRIARRRDAGGMNYLMASGKGACFRNHERLTEEEYLVIANVDGRRTNARVFLAASISQSEIEQDFAGDIEESNVVEWDSRTEAVQAFRRRHVGAVVFKQQLIKDSEPEAVCRAVLQGVREIGLNSLPWTKELSAWRARVAFLHRNFPEEWPDVSDEALLATMEDWLAPFLSGISRRDHFRRIDLTNALRSLLDWEMQSKLDDYAPTHLPVPSGSRQRLDYETGDIPILPVRIQQVFGMSDTPRIAGGKIPVLIHLLSPAQRPVQVTQDLANFWAETYEYVKKELKGRYPKHYWPENPLEAEPTNRAKPRR